MAGENDVGPQFRKSSKCTPSDNCVEVARFLGVGVIVRHSRYPDGLWLPFTTDEWRAFILGVLAGEFDYDIVSKECRAMAGTSAPGTVQPSTAARRAKRRWLLRGHGAATRTTADPGASKPQDEEAGFSLIVRWRARDGSGRAARRAAVWAVGTVAAYEVLRSSDGCVSLTTAVVFALAVKGLSKRMNSVELYRI
jgi:hypothetical protein